MKRVARGRLEGGIDPDVELGRLRSLGMDQERTDADAIGNGCDLEEAVLDELRAKSPALLADVNAEPCENDDGDLMSADSLFQAFRRVLRRDGPRAQRVVADHIACSVATDHVDLGRVRSMRLERVLSKPGRLFLGAAVEGRCDVARSDRLDPTVPGHSWSRTLGRDRNAARPGIGRSSRASSSMNASQRSGGRTKVVRSARTCCAAAVAWESTNALVLIALAAAASSSKRRFAGSRRSSSRSSLRLVSRATVILHSMYGYCTYVSETRPACQESTPSRSTGVPPLATGSCANRAAPVTVTP